MMNLEYLYVIVELLQYNLIHMHLKIIQIILEVKNF